ncbi:hypothetical protein QN277_017303 [Acacia crassicarpa]|uniref:Uncharacterized protein n=1 Tax=Acacia crassicarpa TaxID=499986 RepID=A0AAE1KFY6_9FABA|nr:hypothetical protein QN277_017303 [Acacia crassicarpa]
MLLHKISRIREATRSVLWVRRAAAQLRPRPEQELRNEVGGEWNRRVVVGACENPSVRVNWDGYHFTEVANRFLFNRISTGAFSDPRLPLSSPCCRPSTSS